MSIPKTYLSIHDVTGLQARIGYAVDRPLELVIDSPHGAMQIVIFLQPLLTKEQIEAIADTINVVMKTPKPPKETCPKEAAAYGAEGDYYARLKADLNRHPIEKEAC